MPANILCLGDSQTLGDESNAFGHRSYRGPLQTALATAGISFDMVGSVVSQPASGGTDAEVAAWAGASMDATGDAGNNLTDRLAALKTAYPSLDLLIILVGWPDVYNDPASIASRYSTFLNAVQSGAWSSVKAVICTLSPEPGKSEAQTGGTHAAYAALNAQIRSMASGSRIVCDLAAISGASQSVWVDGMLYDAQAAPDFQTVGDSGALVASRYGGHLITSFQSIQDFNAQWNPNPPFPVGPGGAQLMDLNVVSYTPESGNRFVNNVAGITPWFWVYALEGNTATNAIIRTRNMYAGALRSNGTWGYFFSGARTGDTSQAQFWNGTTALQFGGMPDGRMRAAYDPDGISTQYRPVGPYGIEVWPVDTSPSRGVLDFYGGFNRDLMVNGVCFFFGVQVQFALQDPNGPNDIAQARFGAACGCDFTTPLGGKHYDRYGWPYNVSDGGHDRWKRLANSTEWQWVTSITIGSDDSGNPEHHWWDPGTPPPIANWSPATPYNNPGTYSRTASQIRSNPPPLPSYVSGGGTGWTDNDFFLVSPGVRDIHWTQAGADKVALEISSRIVATGILSSFTSVPGNIPPSLLPGLPLQPNVFLKLDGANRAIGLRAWSSDGSGNPDSAPSWDIAIPTATFNVGEAVSGGFYAGGTPAPVYTKVSGPGWLTVNSATGAFSGTAPAVPESNYLILRASNGVGSPADLGVTVLVTNALSVVTTAIPTIVQNVPYFFQVQASGAGAITFSATGLPFGLEMSSLGVISGTAATVATGSTTVTVTNSAGTANRSIAWDVAAASSLPAITTATLPSGTVGTAYLAEIAATGTQPITYGAAGVPAGLALLYHKSNVVPNSDFSQGTTGWNKVTGSETLAVIDGALRVTGAGGGAFAGAHRSIATEPGTLYRLRITIKATNRQLIIGLRSPILWPITSENTLFPATPGTYELTHVAEAATMTVFVHQADSALSVQFDADDIEVAPMTKNLLRNPSGQGAVVGTVGAGGAEPTHWTIATSMAGVTRTVVGRWVEAGLEYTDVRFHGTPVAGGVCAVYPETPTGIAATTGQTFTFSQYQRLTGGSTAGLNSPAVVFDELTAAGAFIRNTLAAVAMPTGAALSTQRVSASATLSGGATVRVVRPYWLVGVTSGVAIDFTIRIGGPQLEPGTAATFFADPRYAYLSGTPTAPGFYVLAATATNSLDTDDAALSLTINPSPAVSAAQSGGWGKFIRQ